MAHDGEQVLGLAQALPASAAGGAEDAEGEEGAERQGGCQEVEHDASKGRGEVEGEGEEKERERRKRRREGEEKEQAEGCNTWRAARGRRGRGRAARGGPDAVYESISESRFPMRAGREAYQSAGVAVGQAASCHHERRKW